MTFDENWTAVTDAVAFAVSRIAQDRDELNEREAADGHRYILRLLAAISETSLVDFDPAAPAFMRMVESVRALGAAGPDIDYDVAPVQPGIAHRITGSRGGASYVGLAVYSAANDQGPSSIVLGADIDALAAADGTFTYEFRHPSAARVIMRQYFHDRATQPRGSWTIERLESVAARPQAMLPTTGAIAARLGNMAASLRWNAQLNQLWSPELRDRPNSFVRQTADDIIAAIPNPDVTYAFGWWRIGEHEALVIDVDPPDTRYWGLQICDRWFQSYPERRTNLNDRHAVRNRDHTVRIVLAHADPGVPNWLDTSGHRTGTMFFRWLHADPPTLPTARVVPVADVATSV